MKFFTNKNITKKLIIVLAFLTLFNFCCPKTVKAAWTLQEITNTVLTATAKLFYSIFDGLISTTNKIFIGKDPSETENKIFLSPENIIKNKFLLTDANIFKNINREQYYDTKTGAGDNKLKNNMYNGKVELRKTILGWYYSLRNLAIIAMLSVLVYVAIRMIISSASSDKAKYKIMLKDWLVAICLIFFMHYIMVGILGITDSITEAIGSNGQSTTSVSSVRAKIENKLYTIDSSEDETVVSQELSAMWGYLCIYAALIVLTIIFAVKYIKRSLTITFLILLAPISCITYPIDKIGDGKSQAFDFWLKEFIMEIIIQPFHMLLYAVLIGAAIEMAETNLIYAIMCYAIMLPAEKFIKQMFGINEKLGSPLADMASVAAASGLAKKATSMLGKGSDGKNGSSSNGNDTENNLPPRQKGNIDAYDEGEDRQQSNSGRNSNGNVNESDEDTPPDDSRQLNSRPESMGDGTDINLEDENLNNNDNNNIEQDENERINDTLNSDEDNEYNSDNRSDSDSEDQNEEQDDEEDREQIERRANQTKQVGNVRKFARGVKEAIGKDVRKKHGTTNAKKLAIKGAKSVGKGLLRAGLAGIGAGVMGMTALATGNPKAVLGAIGAGAALGNAAGRKISGVASKVGGTAGKYYKAGKSAVKGESVERKKVKENYMQDQNKRNYATQRLQDKNGGQIPSKKEVDAELEKRWEYYESGIKDDDIIDAALDLEEQKEVNLLNNGNYTNEQRKNYNDVEQRLQNNEKGNQDGIRYQKAYEQLQKNEITDEYFNAEFGRGEAEKARDHQIMENKAKGKRKTFRSQTLYAASIANSYSKSDFNNRRKMDDLKESNVQDVLQAYKAEGKEGSREKAEQIVEDAINDAAKIKGIESGANMSNSRTRKARRSTSTATNR